MAQQQKGPWLVKIGLNALDRQDVEQRYEPGAVVDELPRDDVSWLLEQGVIERASQTIEKSEPDSDPEDVSDA